jgi:molecular chaperone Hsp33
MPDGLVRAITADGLVRGFAAVTTGVVEEARRRHGTLPTATAALGRALTSALLLGGLAKADERTSLEFGGDGPLGRILVEARPDGAVRGYVSRPQTHLPARNGKLDVGGAVGRGVLCVVRVPPEGTSYQSVVPLVSGEIGSDVAHYLASSEQVPSAVGVGVWVEADGRVGAAGGYLVQAMPGAEPATLARLEWNVQSAETPSTLVRRGLDAPAMLERLLDGVAVRHLDERPVRFECRCGVERVRAAIVAMGRQELADILGGERRVEAVCEFCGTRYVVEEEELRRLLAAAG